MSKNNITKDEQKILTLEINFLNLRRTLKFNVIFFICNLLIVLLNLYNSRHGIGNQNPFSRHYMPVYLAMTGYFFTVSLVLFWKKPATKEEVKIVHILQVYLFSLVVLVWCSAITFIDLRVNGGITVFILGSIGLSVVLFMGLIWRLIVYASAGVLLVFLLTSFPSTPDKYLADMLNGSILVLISYIIAQTIYSEKIAQIRKDILLRIQKQELEISNVDLNDQNAKNALLQIMIRNYIPKTTWESADFQARSYHLNIPEEEIEITCLFIDLVGFTSYAEKIPPKMVITRLNEVYAPIVRIIHDQDGDIDKFIGDAIFAVFKTAKGALTSALQILRNFQAEIGIQKASFRVGIHSGKAIRGDVGGEDRRDNTLIGDVVNVAARLQQVCNPDEITISEIAWQKSGYALPSGGCEELMLKGKTQPIRIYRIGKELVEKMV